MNYQFRPFLARITHQDSPTIIWAANAEQARQLFHQHYPDLNEDEILVEQPADILIPEKMLAQTELENMRGDLKSANNEGSPRFIVPHTLAEQQNAVIYLRSKKRQKPNNSSFERQREACEAFAKAAGLNVIETYSEVASSDFASQTLLHSALEDLEAGRATVIIVETKDRLSRSRKDSSEIHHRIYQSGANLVKVLEQIPGSPEYEQAATSSTSFHHYKLDLARQWGLAD